ncbi:MAG: hypothetical protein ACREIU_05270 [Planctomycetota bacterium]
MNPTAIVRALAFLVALILSAAEAGSTEPASPTVYRIGVVGGG